MIKWILGILALFLLPDMALGAWCEAPGECATISATEWNNARAAGGISGTAFPGAPSAGDQFIITDDSAVGACDSAAGSAITLCRYNGAAWEAVSYTVDEVGTLTSGDLCINDGSIVNCTVNTIAELETALDAEDILTATEGDAAYQPLDAELTTIAGLAETNGNVMFVAAGAWTSDPTPAIDCTDCINIPEGTTHSGTLTWSGTAILESGIAFQFGDGTDATVTHTYANTGTNVDVAYSTGAMAVTGALTATNLSGTNTGDNDEVGTLTTGDLCVNDGSAVNCTVNTEAELEAALDALDVVTVTAGDISSANVATMVSDETGTGAVVLGTSPTIATPTINTSITSNAGDPADGGYVRLGNTEQLCWEASPASTDVCLSVDANEVLQITGGGADAADLSTGTIPAARVGAAHVDAITEIAAALKSGADTTLITGTAGTSGNCAEWNIDGDVVDSGAACGGGTGDSIEVEDGDDGGTFTAIDTTARFEDQGDINFTFADGGAGGPDTITATVRANAIALTTDTTGGYAASTTEGGGATSLEADAVDAISEIDAGIKRGPDATDTHLLTTDVAAPAGARCLEMDTDGSVTLAADTCANLGPGGTTTLDALGDAGGIGAVQVGSNQEYGQTWTWNTPATTVGQLDGLSLVMELDATTDAQTQNILVVERDNTVTGAQTLEALVQLNNNDADGAVTNAVQVTAGAGGITNAFDINDAQITNAFVTPNATIGMAELELLDAGARTDEALCSYETTGNQLECDVNNEATLETALGALDVVTVTTNDISSVNLQSILTDETGTGAVVFAGAPSIRLKVDRNDSAVSDDDCTGEQGLWWYDTTDSQFEFCNANSGVPATLAAAAGDITDVFDCATGDCASITISATDLLDMSGSDASTATEGLILPQHATACAGGTAEGQVCWEADANILHVGDGAALQNFPPASAFSGDATLSATGTVAIQADSVALTTDTTGNYAAGDAEAGAALTGDTATAFFAAGTIEHERGGLEADVNVYSGLLAIAAGATAEIDAKSELEGQIADVTDFAEADGDVFTGVHDFGGVTSLEIPNGASPTVDAVGKVGVDTTDNQVLAHNGSATVVLGTESTKCMIIETPADADNFLFFRAERAITIAGIDCLVNAATSAVITIQECDANGGTCGTTEAAITCGTTNTAEAAGIDDSAVDAGDWMRVDVGTVTGTPGHVNVCVRFTETRT